jgi:hypothetical protein
MVTVSSLPSASVVIPSMNPTSGMGFIVIKLVPNSQKVAKYLSGIWREPFFGPSGALKFLADRLNEDREKICAYKAPNQFPVHGGLKLDQLEPIS